METIFDKPLDKQVADNTQAIANTNSEVTKLKARVSLRLNTNATSTTTSYDTYNGRKFSDYRYLLFYLYTSASDTSIIRDCKIIPSGSWTSGRRLQLAGNHGSSFGSLSVITFLYDSDTAIQAVTGGAGSLIGFEIQGIESI